MTSYYHSAGKDHRVVECCSCGEPMNSIYDPDIRDTCRECGGKSKAIDPKEAREQIRKEYLAKLRAARHA